MSDPGSRVVLPEPTPSDASLHGDEKILADLARFDWLVVSTRLSRRLHCPVESTPDADLWALTDVTFACGWQVQVAWIPGLFTRSGAPRCSHCCDRAGFPRGIGSPKNDDECRRILGLPREVEA